MFSKVKGFKQAGFTLIELAIAVLIIAILAAIAVPKFVLLSDQAKLSAVKDAIGTAQTSLAVYRAENDDFPTLAQLANQIELRTTATQAYYSGVDADQPSGISITIDKTNYIIRTFTDSNCSQTFSTGDAASATGTIRCVRGTYPAISEF